MYPILCIAAWLSACGTGEPRVDAEAEHGKASFYGPELEGRAMASGEVYRAEGLTAAHNSLPFGSIVRVTRPKTGDSVRVVITDRGPFAAGRIIDLSERAARQLGMTDSGVARVELQVVGCDEAYGGC